MRCEPHCVQGSEQQASVGVGSPRGAEGPDEEGESSRVGVG